MVPWRLYSPAQVALFLVNISVLTPKGDVDSTDCVGAAYALPKVGKDNAGPGQRPVGCFQATGVALDAVLALGGLRAVGCRLPLQETERGAVISGLCYQGERLARREQKSVFMPGQTIATSTAAGDLPNPNALPALTSKMVGVYSSSMERAKRSLCTTPASSTVTTSRANHELLPRGAAPARTNSTLELFAVCKRLGKVSSRPLVS